MNPTGRMEWMKAAVDRFNGPLTRYAFVITGDLERARDIAQETFLRLCQEDPARVEGHLAEWLFTVCRHRALDVLRKENRMKPLEAAGMDTQASLEPSPATQAERRDLNTLALQVLATLPPHQQEVVRLKFQNGLSYQEISRITRLTVTNVGFLIHTALKNLRHELRHEPAFAQHLPRRTS